MRGGRIECVMAAQENESAKEAPYESGERMQRVQCRERMPQSRDPSGRGRGRNARIAEEEWEVARAGRCRDCPDTRT